MTPDNIAASPGRQRSLRERIAFLWRRARFWADIVCVVRLNGLAVLGAVAASIFWFGRDEQQLSAFFDRVTFFNTLAVLAGALLIFYVLVVAVPYAWFVFTYYILRRNRNQILFKFPKDSCVAGEPFHIDAILQRKMRLLFGTITFRLVFFDYSSSARSFMLRSQRRRGELFNSSDRGAIGSFAIRLPHAGRYRTRYSVVKFEDPFGFFSLPIVEREFHPSDPDRNFYIYAVPPRPDGSAAPYYVKRSSVPSASEQRYKVAEDFFDTKRYEPTDDSRRILWQVYGRTRQLLVRIPERDSVIDADIDLYILFYNAFLGPAGGMRAEFDRFVTDAGRFLEGLLRVRALTVRIHTDCPADPPYADDPALPREENLRRALVSNHWHRDAEPARFLQEANARRSPDRERILLVNPYIPPDALPLEQTAQFTNVFVTGAGRRPSSGKDGFSLLFHQERGKALRTLRGALGAGTARRMRRNSIQLASRFREAVFDEPGGRVDGA